MPFYAHRIVVWRKASRRASCHTRASFFSLSASLSPFLLQSDHDYSAIQRSAANVTWMSMRPVPTLSMLGIYQRLISKTQAPRSFNVRHAIRSLSISLSSSLLELLYVIAVTPLWFPVQMSFPFDVVLWRVKRWIRWPTCCLYQCHIRSYNIRGPSFTYKIAIFCRMGPKPYK